MIDFIIFRPPSLIMATGEAAGHSFALSAAGMTSQEMDCTLRHDRDPLVPIKLTLPPDVTREELELIVDEILVNHLGRREAAA